MKLFVLYRNTGKGSEFLSHDGWNMTKDISYAEKFYENEIDDLLDGYNKKILKKGEQRYMKKEVLCY